MGTLARDHRRADRARHHPHPMLYGTRFSKAAQRVLFDTAHLGSGSIEGLGKVKE